SPLGGGQLGGGTSPLGGGQLGGGTSPLGGGQLGGGTSPLGGGSGSGGQQVQPSSPASGAFLGVATQQDTNGVKIAQVASGSAAEKAGLQVGDVITAFNGRSVTSPTALGTAVANLQTGDQVQITVDRNGQTSTVSVTLGSRSTSNSN
ncbi:MAG: PDZ domain-containing protein, partial [Actinomycetes bacterium]